MMKYLFFNETAIGRIALAEEDGAITNMFFEGQLLPEGWEERETALLRRAADELTEYLAGKRRVFTVPLAPAGTAFQRLVWAALQEIPYGETCTYKELAAAVGKPKACRAVGGANHRNPISVLIPCHRVIGANGTLVGYGGGLPMKQRLLALEHSEALVKQK